MIVSMLRVKNEARWLEAVLNSIAPLTREVVVFDDSSTDDTYDIAKQWGADVIRSPFKTLNEAKDKNFLLSYTRKKYNPEWCLLTDGDELLDIRSVPVLQEVAQCINVQCISFKIRFLWNDYQTVRTDGVYGMFRRQSMFRPGNAQFVDLGDKHPNFHCGNTPRSLFHRCAYPEVALLHLGYLNREDRIRKRAWYIEQHRKMGALDQLALEDDYRHITVGDECPADSKFRHGGPLKLEAL
jgi:glycosyltransferase involved in cell wall biosynthesis